MELIRKQVNNPIAVGAAGLVIGLLLGLLYAWVLNPVDWVDAPINLLRADLKEDYLRMAIDSYALNRDANQALERFAQLGLEAEGLLNVVAANPGNLNPQAIADFRNVVGAPVGLPEVPVEEEAAGGGLLGTLLPIACVVTLFLLVGLAALYRFRTGGLKLPSLKPTQPATGGVARTGRAAKPTAVYPSTEEPPIVQFMSTYKLGDDLFDDSFSIDAPSGEFLGECGVGVSETIGVGEPKKVTAFEVWLFDKYDIETVTKVAMSAHAFLDEGIRQRLTAKGEPILAEPGAELVLETQSLRMVARIVDMAYGSGAVPESSYFERMTLELAIWSKK